MYEGEFFDTFDVLDDNRQESKVQYNLMLLVGVTNGKRFICGHLPKQILFG